MSKMASGQLSSLQSMDTSPITPRRDNSFSPVYSLSSSQVSADALAGPQDASRRSTQELKQEARLAGSRPELLNIEKLPAKSFSRSRSGQREDLDQVESELQAEIQDRVNNSSIQKGQDSSYSSMSSGDSFGCSSMPSDNWEDELQQYKHLMPPQIRLGYIDVLILYCEEDREEAQKFQTHLREEIEIENGHVITLLYDDAEMQAICGSKIGHLAQVVERSTYVFIFMTKNFIQDKWCEFSSESCLMEAITNPLKQWCVVPVYTEKRNSSFRVPMGLNTLKGINYYNNDRFYKNGVARLIGDKIYVRAQANEEHKIKQKEWLEEYKRDQIRRKEAQRRLEEKQKAMTQQLLDWLEQETRRLIQTGALPDYLPHSYSESDISSHDSSLSHSSSSSSLKPVHSQNPAVARYFQELTAQQKVYNGNSGNYSPEQINIIERVYGSISPITPGFPSHVSPPVMNPYLGQGHFGQGNFQGQGYFPPVQNSVSYQQQYQHQVKRSTSQASADMEPSTEFILHTETGDVSVTVPCKLVEKIQGVPEDEQQLAVRLYCNEMANQQQKQQQQNMANQLMIPAHNQYPANQSISTMGLENRNQSQDISSVHGSTSPQSQLLSQTNSNPLQGQGGIPHFEAFQSMNNTGSYRTGSSYNESSTQSRMSSGMVPSQPGSFQGQLGSNMDGHNSELPGNLPTHSILEPDAGSSLNSRAYQSITAGQEQVYQTEKTTVKETQSDSDSVSDEDIPKERKKKRKGKEKSVVHIHKTYIYQPKTVQIGDHNVVQEPASEEEGEDAEEIVVGDSEIPVPENKIGVGKDPSVSLEEKQQMMKVDIKPGSEMHGEIQDQPNSAGVSSSCHVDAAPSNEPSGVPQIQPDTGRKRFIQEQTTIKSIKEEDLDVKSVEYINNFEKKFENSFKIDDCEILEQTTDEKNSKFEESENLNSPLSIEKSSSLKRKEMPLDYSPLKQEEKPTCVARPVVRVQPFTPKMADDYDDNCDNTDPKIAMQTSQTIRKTVSNSQGVCSTEETFVKQAWGAENTPSSGRKQTEPMQRNIPVQVLTKTVDSDDSVRNGSAKFSSFNPSDPQKLFFNQRSPPVVTNDDVDNTASVSGRQEVALGNDPLSRETQEEPATRSFIPQSSRFSPMDDNDLEYDMLDSGNYESAEYPNQSSTSFEESGTRSNRSWNKKGSSSSGKKDQCFIS